MLQPRRAAGGVGQLRRDGATVAARVRDSEQGAPQATLAFEEIFPLLPVIGWGMLIICVGCVIPRRIHREFAARPRHTAARPRRTASLSEVEAQRRQTERLRREVARLQAEDGQCARSRPYYWQR